MDFNAINATIAKLGENAETIKLLRYGRITTKLRRGLITEHEASKAYGEAEDAYIYTVVSCSDLKAYFQKAASQG